MESETQFPLKPKVILPDDVSHLEENFDDLMGPTMQDVNAELGPEEPSEVRKSLVHIVVDEEAHEDFFEEKTEKVPRAKVQRIVYFIWFI